MIGVYIVENGSKIFHDSILDLTHDFFPPLDLIIRYFLLFLFLLHWICAVMDPLILQHDTLYFLLLLVWMLLLQHFLTLFLFLSSYFLALLQQALLSFLHALHFGFVFVRANFGRLLFLLLFNDFGFFWRRLETLLWCFFLNRSL